ncbi:peptidase [Pannonibacter phragmitetus]|uniref:penicillin-insensitive murein endopeptidase n=1 Tax=Pannonibacter phragmitetus TaxID=121719 RepID=UPI00067CE737|nr:penicillin-insensitive murein endopeptidase [Pannonibacter phragmitetus]KND17376.1 peptidase [Pannonibacter phragmitetus]
MAYRSCVSRPTAARRLAFALAALGLSGLFDAAQVVEASGTPVAKPAAREAAASRLPRNLDPNAPAKDYFGAMRDPAPLASRAIGSYAKGCLAGASALPINGPSWQVMRLSRNRNWGHPALISFLEDFATKAPKVGWRGLLVGDLSQPRGGPMTSGHSSHQIGLDADIWLTPMPDRVLSRDERENISAISMVKQPQDVAGADRSVDPKRWTDTHAALIRLAAKDRRVARIFVNPAIKKALCQFETGDRAWLRKVRPWWGHDYHFHVRMSCPAGSVGCADQDEPPQGDGCGTELTSWLADGPWVPKIDPETGKPPPVQKKRPLALAALPKTCGEVLTAR